MFLWVTLGVLKKKIWNFSGFTSKPEALVNKFKHFLKDLFSWTEGFPISMVSSTNYWWVCLSIPLWIFKPRISPLDNWPWINKLIPSIVMRNMKGERVSSWLMPWVGFKVRVGEPFRKIEKNIDDTMFMIHSIQCLFQNQKLSGFLSYITKSTCRKL